MIHPIRHESSSKIHFRRKAVSYEAAFLNIFHVVFTLFSCRFHVVFTLFSCCFRVVFMLFSCCFHLAFFTLFIFLFSKNRMFVISRYFLAEISIFVFVRCFASPNSENGGGYMFFVRYHLVLSLFIFSFTLFFIFLFSKNRMFVISRYF